MILDPNHREVTFLLDLKPRVHAFGRARLIVVERRRVHNGFVEDVQNGIRVLFVCALNDGVLGHEDFLGRAVVLAQSQRIFGLC